MVTVVMKMVRCGVLDGMVMFVLWLMAVRGLGLYSSCDDGCKVWFCSLELCCDVDF